MIARKKKKKKKNKKNENSNIFKFHQTSEKIVNYKLKFSQKIFFTENGWDTIEM